MKILKLPNNANNRLSCEYFSYINLAPPERIKESELVQQFRIEVKDGSVEPFVAERITFARLKLCDISEMDTYLAAGIGRDEFILTFGSQKEVEVAIYIFRRILTTNQQIT